MARPTSALPAILGLLLLILLPFLPKLTLAQTRAMCITQFSLANQACAVMPGDRAPTDPQRIVRQEDDDGDYDDDHEHGHHHGHGHRHGDDGGEREHGHGHGHHDHEDDDEPRANMDCCRWLKEVDHDCVCEAMVRLPLFLVKPKHTYSISVGNSCKLTYKCGGL